MTINLAVMIIIMANVITINEISVPEREISIYKPRNQIRWIVSVTQCVLFSNRDTI